jgi:hypothetical protein
MNKYLIILAVLIFGYPSFAQTGSRVVQSIKGKVIDEITNEAVAYTNIGIEGTFYGTASDADGNFELKIPEEMVSRQIFFSALSYKNDTFPVSDLFDREFSIIKLEPLTYDIEDVDVAALSRVLIRILRMASEHTPYNFLGGPFNLVCTFDNEKIIDDTLKVTDRAEVLIYDRTGYRNPSKTEAFKMRNYELRKETPDYSFATGITNFDELLGLDWVRSATSVLNPALLSTFNLSLEDETVVDGKLVWVISFSQDVPTLAGSQDFHATQFSGRITIAKEDYSVIKIEGKGESARHHRQGKNLAVGNSNSNYFEDVTYDFSISYSRLKPDIFSLNKRYRFNGKIVEEKSRLLVNQVQMADVKEITTRNYFAK